MALPSQKPITVINAARFFLVDAGIAVIRFLTGLIIVKISKHPK